MDNHKKIGRRHYYFISKKDDKGNFIYNDWMSLKKIMKMKEVLITQSGMEIRLRNAVRQGVKDFYPILIEKRMKRRGAKYYRIMKKINGHWLYNRNMTVNQILKIPEVKFNSYNSVKEQINVWKKDFRGSISLYDYLVSAQTNNNAQNNVCELSNIHKKEIKKRDAWLADMSMFKVSVF